MKKWKVIVPLTVVAGLGVWSVLSFWPQKTENQEVVAANPQSSKVTKKGRMAEKGQRLQRSTRLAVNSHDAHKIKVRPSFAIDDDDEASLNAEQRKLIEAIRDALNHEDKKRVLKLVHALQTSDEWPDGIPKSIKMAAIEALGWFGSACLPEVVGFLGDGDDDVVRSAIEKFETALCDLDLSDRERSVILIQASKVINDSDAMESMLFELNNMRHSVAVETLKALMVDGNEATKKVLADQIEFYTGEENLDTPKKLDEWLEKNPDDADDEAFYGGSKG